MLPEKDFWNEIDRLLLQQDIAAAATLVNEHLESFHDILKSKFDEAKVRRYIH